MHKKFIVYLVILYFGSIIAKPVLAEEIVISGNGDSSVNQASVTSENQVTVSQTNQASITNNISVNADTGGNTANSNSGENTSIETGSVNINTTVTNSANQSDVNITCCPAEDKKVLISDNSALSQNSINAAITNNTTVIVSQIASIDNNLKVTANTGSNRADYNAGNVNITTGNISVKTNTKNSKINDSLIKLPLDPNLDFLAKISNNSYLSENRINTSLNGSFLTYINNLADITNNLDIDANTGKNAAEFNNGDVAIKSGDVIIASNVENDQIDSSIVSFSCCSSENKNQTPPPSQPGSSGGGVVSSSGGNGGGGSGSSGGSGGGEVLGSSSSGQILPSTGSSWVLMLTLLSALMFSLGLYLRLHPGQDPGMKVIYC